MKQQLTQIVIALTIILWFIPLPTADACGNATFWAAQSKRELANAEIVLSWGENKEAIELAKESKFHGTFFMKLDADKIIAIANVRLVLAFPKTHTLNAKVFDGKKPLQKMRYAEYLLAKNQPKKALKILRRLKRRGKMPNRFGWFALSKAEKTMGHPKRAKYALAKAMILQKKMDKERTR